MIEEATHEIVGQVNKQLTENKLKCVVPEAHCVDLVISLQSVLSLLQLGWLFSSD